MAGVMSGGGGSTVGAAPPAGVDAVAGDVDCDGDVDAVDAQGILEVVAGLDDDPGCIDAGDVNCDGSIDATDSLEVLRSIAGLAPGNIPADCPPIGGVDEVPPLEIEADSSIEPERDEVANPFDDAPRPVAAMVDEDGVQSPFVENELIVVTDDDEALAAFADRWNGEILSSLDPEDLSGFEDLTAVHLLRVEASEADTSDLAEDLRELNENSFGELRVSSEEGMGLLSAAADEMTGGMDVGINWVLEGGTFDQRETFEHPAGSGGYTPNAFDWPYMDRGSNQDIGVGDAWRAMKAADAMGNKVKITVLDGGFSPNDDFPEGYEIHGGANIENPASCTGGSSCLWHGTTVTAAAMGVPDNGYGVAGPAGPIAEATLVQSPDLDLFQVLEYIFVSLPKAAADKPAVLNISAGVAIPREVCFALGCKYLNALTETIRFTDTLVFAAAMNDDQDVDAERCIDLQFDKVCYEKRVHLPCELNDVVCVGGLGWDTTQKHANSNYGTKPSSNTVDIFGPFVQYVTPNPDQSIPDRDNCGTSCATPFVAGVAALVKSISGASAGAIADHLRETAHTGSGDPLVPRWVNAYEAVITALGGNEPPEAEITDPANGAEVLAGFPFPLFANVTDPEDRPSLGTPWDGQPGATWVSDVDGLLGTSPTISGVTPPSYGEHVITLVVVDSAGWEIRDSVTVEIVNEPPDVEITSPEDNATFFEGETVTFRATSFDPNEPGTMLPDENLVWYRKDVAERSTQGDDPGTQIGTGHELETTLPLGGSVITLRGTDEAGAVDVETIAVIVEEPPPDLPPSVVITSPPNGTDIGCTETITLTGEAIDPEDGALSGNSMVWTLNFEGTTQIGVGQSVQFQFTDDSDKEGVEDFTITLRATDSEGNTRSDTIAMHWSCLL